MGWLREDGRSDQHEHEGYLVAVEREPDGWPWREIGGVADEARAREHGPIEVRWIQVACDCGWRSQRLVAPFMAEWSPCSVFLRTDRDEDEFIEVWATEHRDRLDNVADARRTARRRALWLPA